MTTHVYSNYFSAYRKEIPSDTLLLSIARTQPKSIRLQSFDKLFPPVKLLWDYKDKKITWEEYEREYKKQVLATLEPADVLAELKELAGDKKSICLLCWEKSEEHCHRRLVMEWLNENNITKAYRR